MTRGGTLKLVGAANKCNGMVLSPEKSPYAAPAAQGDCNDQNRHKPSTSALLRHNLMRY
jgi:hypothetical protein